MEGFFFIFEVSTATNLERMKLYITVPMHDGRRVGDVRLLCRARVRWRRIAFFSECLSRVVVLIWYCGRNVGFYTGWCRRVTDSS